MKKNSGQTFVEFALIFAVLLSATAGIYNIYKSAWKKKYEKTAMVGNIIYTSATGGYVK
jgi:hypothetical protein